MSRAGMIRGTPRSRTRRSAVGRGPGRQLELAGDTRESLLMRGVEPGGENVAMAGDRQLIEDRSATIVEHHDDQLLLQPS